MKRHFIYKFTNKITGQVYIGQTINLKSRYNNHIWQSKNKGKSYISRAINIYGIENFTFEEIFSTIEQDEANDMEIKFIKDYKSLAPNGYNLDLGGKNTEKNSLSCELLSKINQGKKSSKSVNLSNTFIGVVSKNGYHKCCVRINRKIKSKNFKTEIEAAEAYDKMVLFLYGSDAKINFENLRCKYLELDLQKFFNFFIERSVPKTSKYQYVKRYRKSNRWTVFLNRGNKSIPKLKLGLFNNETDAAIIVDKINFFFDLKLQYNFPELLDNYNKLELKDFFDSLSYKEHSEFQGVSRSGNGYWRSYFYFNKKQISCGNQFKTELDAKNARDAKMKEFFTVRKPQGCV